MKPKRNVQAVWYRVDQVCQVDSAGEISAKVTFQHLSLQKTEWEFGRRT